MQGKINVTKTTDMTLVPCNDIIINELKYLWKYLSQYLR